VTALNNDQAFDLSLLISVTFAPKASFIQGG
jgi:hypothetical protein